MFVNAFVEFKEEWLDYFKDKEQIAINEEDYEEYKKREEAKKNKNKNKKTKTD